MERRKGFARQRDSTHKSLKVRRQRGACKRRDGRRLQISIWDNSSRRG